MNSPAGAQIETLTKVNDFVVKFANVNGSGSASANTLFAKAIFRMGIPVSPHNIFPSNIQGLPTWYELASVEQGNLADDLLVGGGAGSTVYYDDTAL